MFVLFRALRASPGVLCTVKLDEEKSKVAGLAQHNCKVCGRW
jgi:hypothetical protein